MAASFHTTDKLENSLPETIALSEVCKFDIPEFEAHVHAYPSSRNTGTIQPFDEKMDAVNALMSLKQGAIQFPPAPTVREHNALTHSSEDQQISLATESKSVSIPPENKLEDQKVGHSNGHVVIPCSVYPTTEPIRESLNERELCKEQETSSEDVISNLESHAADSMEVSTRWDNGAWVLEHENILLETVEENFPNKHHDAPGDQLENQAMDDLFSQDEWPELSQLERSPSPDQREQLADLENWINVPEFATDPLKETRSSSLIPDHHSPSHDTPREAILDSAEQTGILNATTPAPTDPKNREGVTAKDMNHACDETVGVAVDQYPRVGSQSRSQSTSPIIIDTNNGEPIVIEDSSDETADMTMEQYPRAGSQSRSQSMSPIIIDTNNGEPIVIEDSSDSSDISAFSDSSDIASDPRTRAGSQRRVRSRPLRVLEGMVRWSDENLAMGNRTVIQRLWTEARNYWKSMYRLKCFAKSKSVKKFNKMMVKAKERPETDGGTICLKDAGKLHRKFKHILARLHRKMCHSAERKLANSLDRTLKELCETVEVITMMTEPPADDGGDDDGDYKPRVATKRL